MSKQTYIQIIKTKDKKTQSAVSEYIALSELNQTVKTKEDREAWEMLWKEFLNSNKWIYAITFVQKYGV